jgi:sensor domain CHASE-containing protein
VLPNFANKIIESVQKRSKSQIRFRDQVKRKLQAIHSNFKTELNYKALHRRYGRH